MRDTFKIECLTQALQNVVAAKNEHDIAREEFHENGGYSWGYHGQPYIKKVEDASGEFGNLLNDYIDSRVKQIVGDKP